MVIQQKSFCLAASKAFEIPLESFNPLSPSQVLVWELSFGPDGAECGHSCVRPVGLYFNLKQEEVRLAWPESQAKRYRWKPNQQEERNFGIERLDFFEMVRPHDAAAFNLTTRILKCHLEELRLKTFPSLDDSSCREAHESVKLELAALKRGINSHIAHWKRSAWPINEGREKFDEETPVPAVDAEYNPSPMAAESNSAETWKSFLSNIVQSEVDLGKVREQTATSV